MNGIGVHSRQQLRAIASAAKEAADQCSGTRPALVALHLIDEISRPKLQAMLTTSNGLHAVAHAVFRGGKRRTSIRSRSRFRNRSGKMAQVRSAYPAISSS
jgi:hypothetical protein